MAGRLISMTGSEMLQLDAENLLKAIQLSEGRVLAAETVGIVDPLLHDVSNAELASAMSADLLILNMYDVDHPLVKGLPQHEEEETVSLLKRLTGRIVGINLEPVDEKAGEGELWAMSRGRMASVENVRKAKKQGVDLIVLTGNPGNHVSNRGICEAIATIRKEIGNQIVLIAGKMHSSGEMEEAGEKIITKKDVTEFAQAGADIILMPAPGTVPGITTDHIHELASCAHSLGKLVMTSIGTSQEGSDSETIRTIALNCKMAGSDIHHIGDAGYTGIAVPENIMTYSIAIRGLRHTYRRMALAMRR